MTNAERIEELEIALERLLECFDTTVSGQRPWIEVEVDVTGLDIPPDGNGLFFTEGQVTESTADAIELAELALYQDDMELDRLSEDED